jgi:hypothetical protein
VFSEKEKMINKIEDKSLSKEYLREIHKKCEKIIEEANKENKNYSKNEERIFTKIQRKPVI